MYTVIRVERSEGVADCARVLSTHRSLPEAERAKGRVQDLLERARQAGEIDLKRGDIRIVCTADQRPLGRTIPARQLKQLTVVGPAGRLA